MNILFIIALTLSWTAPTENTDGTPLTDLAGYKIYRSSTEGGPYTMHADVPDPEALDYVLDLPAGLYYFVATAYNEAGTESEYSGETFRELVDTPDPPTGLVVTGNDTAYGLQQSDNVITLYPVGTVPFDTPCDSNMSANGHYLVQNDLVDYVGTVRPPTVFAQCSGSGN